MARQITKPGLTEGQHDALDHSGIPGVGGAETFTQEVHDLENHGSVPGVPDITGLLDESAHDGLDHSGLTGVPAAETFPQATHDLEDHTGLPGIVPEAFDQATHDLEDHASIPGVPSIAGLLDETAHSTTDHTGLTGVSAAGELPTAANAAALLGQVSDLLDYSGYRDSQYYDNIDTAVKRAAEAFTANGPGTYQCEVKCRAVAMVLKAEIFTNNAGKPGVLVAAADATLDLSVDEVDSFTWTDLALSEATVYHVVFTHVSGFPYSTLWSHSGGGSSNYSANSGGSWTTTSYFIGIVISFTPSSCPEDLSLGAVEDTGKVYIYDAASKTWSLFGGSAETVADVEESATPTALELKVNELLAVLRTAKIIST